MLGPGEGRDLQRQRRDLSVMYVFFTTGVEAPSTTQNVLTVSDL